MFRAARLAELEDRKALKLREIEGEG